MAYQIEYTSQFKKDYRKALSRGLSAKLIDTIITKILEEKPLPAKHKVHPLRGNYKDCLECHLQPDWLLIWRIDAQKNTLTLIRTGSHSDLF